MDLRGGSRHRRWNTLGHRSQQRSLGLSWSRLQMLQCVSFCKHAAGAQLLCLCCLTADQHRKSAHADVSTGLVYNVILLFRNFDVL